jgi:predicted transglutaminase-like cysteine proteinase
MHLVAALILLLFCNVAEAGSRIVSNRAVAIEISDFQDKYWMDRWRSIKDVRCGHRCNTFIDALNISASSSKQDVMQMLWKNVEVSVTYEQDGDTPDSEKWLAPEETLRRARGDCEDYSLLMRGLLNVLLPEISTTLVLVSVKGEDGFYTHTVLEATDGSTKWYFDIRFEGVSDALSYEYILISRFS